MTSFLTEVLFLFAGIAYDNKTNRVLFIGLQGEGDFVRFFRYLTFATGNTIFQFAALLWELWSFLLEEIRCKYSRRTRLSAAHAR